MHAGYAAIENVNVEQKSLEIEFLIAIFRPTGDRGQSKTLFLAIFDPRSSTVTSVFDFRLYGVMWHVTNLCTLQRANNKGADQTAHMRRLGCTFVVRMQQSRGFSQQDPYM